MPRPLQHALRRWQDHAAIRSEQELEPTLRRRFDRLPQWLANHRTTHAERRLRRHSATEIERELSKSWSSARYLGR